MLFAVFLHVYPIRYTKFIAYYAQKYNLEPSFVASVINAESKFKPNAKSSAGAVGLMQLLPTTADYISSYIIHEDANLFEPDGNIKLGCAYLNYLQNKFSDKFTLLCAYNAGEGNVKTWLNNKKYSIDGLTLRTTPFAETNFYANKVIKNEKIYKKIFPPI